MLNTLRTIRVLLATLREGRLFDLLSQRDHPPYLTRHRLESIVTRIRLVALGFSGLTLVWIGFDAVTLDPAQWQVLAVLRILAVMAFFGLAIVPEKERSRGAVLGMLAAMLAMPMLISAVAQFLLKDTPLAGLAAINGRLYEALPFIVLAGLSIFPLVLIEGMLFAVPMLLIAAAVQVAVAGFDSVRLFSTLWILGLVLGVYLLTCAIQLHYMMGLLRRASHDVLTGALTRRSGIEVIELHFRLASEQRAPLSIAFFDIDDFKGINDKYGHEAGDQVLKEFVQVLTKLLRRSDSIIRWGGEEFVVLLTNTDIAGVRIAMDRLVEEWFGLRPDGQALTASIGVAERVQDEAEDWLKLISLADERMYLAKNQGKARCVLGRDEIVPEQQKRKPLHVAS